MISAALRQAFLQPDTISASLTWPTSFEDTGRSLQPFWTKPSSTRWRTSLSRPSACSSYAAPIPLKNRTRKSRDGRTRQAFSLTSSPSSVSSGPFSWSKTTNGDAKAAPCRSRSWPNAASSPSRSNSRKCHHRRRDRLSTQRRKYFHHVVGCDPVVRFLSAATCYGYLSMP